MIRRLLAPLTVLLCTLANLAAETAWRIDVPVADGRPIRLHLAIDGDSVVRSFAYQPVSSHRGQRSWRRWQPTVALTVTRGWQGTVRLEPQPLGERDESEPVQVQLAWDGAAAAAELSTGGHAPVQRLPDTPQGSDVVFTAWPLWGVPSAQSREDDKPFVGTRHVFGRPHIYQTPMITMPLTGIFDGVETAVPGSLTLDNCSVVQPTALGHLPARGSDSYWRGAVVATNVTLADGAFGGAFDVDMRRGSRGVSFADSRSMGIYRYQLSVEVIGNVVFGTYQANRTEPDARFREPRGQILGFLGTPTTGFRAGVTPLAAVAEPDPALAQRAAAAALQPVHPGERGIEGQAGAYGATRLWHTYYPRFASIHAPIVEVAPVADAVTYRVEVFGAGGGGRPSREVSVSMTTERLPVSLAPVWESLPLGPTRVRVVGLDANQADIAASTEEVLVVKRPAFAGPYYQPVPRAADLRARLLAHARWLLYSPTSTPFMVDWMPGQIVAAGGKNYANPPIVAGGVISNAVLVAELTDDPAERALATRVAESAARWIRSRTGGPHRLPDPYYKCNWWYGLYVGHAWLDLYRLTGDAQWAEAALRLGDSIVTHQQSGGAWPFVMNSYGNGKVGVGQRRGWDGQDPRDAQWQTIGAADFLHYLGRLRALTDDERFVAAEQRALAWCLAKAARSFIWKRRGGYSEQEYTINNRYPTLLVLYLLEYAPAAQRDIELCRRIMTYCESTAVSWGRDHDGSRFLPKVSEYTAPRYTTDDPGAAARYALIFARLAQLPGGDAELDQAKSEALAGSLLANQHPDGLIFEAGRSAKPSSIFTRYSEGQNTAPPHLAELGWRLLERDRVLAGEP